MLALLEKIPHKDNRIIFMGDLINKGPFSFEVYKFIRENNYESLKGNHEFYCINRNKKPYKEFWKNHGGVETEISCKRCQNFKNHQNVEIVLDEMSDFFEGLPEFLVVKTGYKNRFVATHGGISSIFYRENRYHLQDCLNADFISDKPYFFNKEPLAVIPEVTQIIGHQPTPYAPINVNGNYLIDSGCVYDDRRGMGYLSALMFDLKSLAEPVLYRQPNIDL